MRELEKHLPNIFQISIRHYRPTLSQLARDTNRQFYGTGMIIYIKPDNYFFVSICRQTNIFGFETTANLRDTSSLSPVSGNFYPGNTIAWFSSVKRV